MSFGSQCCLHTETNSDGGFYSIVSSCFSAKDTDPGTDLNLAFDHIERQMAFIKDRVKPHKFKEHYHVIIVFTDGKFQPFASCGRRQLLFIIQLQLETLDLLAS